MDLFTKLFGNEKVLNTSIEALRDGLDSLVYTEEEKASEAKLERSEARRMVIEWMNATQGQNLARRLIAITITCMWTSQYILAALFDITSVWVLDSSKWVATADAIGSRAEELNGAMMLVLGFYFSAPYMDKIVGSAINKFGNTNDKNNK